MLSARQQEIYEFICQYVIKKNYAPTIREIGDAVGIASKGVVHRHLQAIIDMDLIETVPNKRRNISVKKFPEQRATLPLLGKIAAGCPIEAIEDQQSLDVAEMVLGPERFALKVQGDSMIDAGIFDGDYVICQQAKRAEQGEIVVALIDQQEATLKRIRYADDQITLIPENPDLIPINYAAERITVQGIYKGVIRLN